MTPTISQEEALLRDWTKTKPKGKEARQSFLNRLLDATEQLADEEWDKLGQEPGGTEAQNWSNNAVTARKEEKPLPDFIAASDEEEETEDEPHDAEEAEEAEEAGEEEPAEKEEPKVKAKTTKAKSTKAKAPAKAPAAKPKPKVAAKEAAPKKLGKKAAPPSADGIKVRIKAAVIDDPHIALDELLDKLSKGGAKMSRMTVASVRSETRHTLRVLQDMGKLRGVAI